MNFEYRNRRFDIGGVSPQDSIYREIVEKHSFYEIDLLEYMYSIRRHMARDNAVAIDVGANIGNHSIFLQSFLADYLIAFEPNPAVLPVLRANLSKNVVNYTVYDCALGEAEGSGVMCLPEEARNNVGMARVGPGGSGTEVRVRTLDEVIGEWRREHEGAGRVSLMKVDVEGMELAVLQGASRTIHDDHPQLFVEAATADQALELREYLGGLGYRMLSRWAATPVYHYGYAPSAPLLLAVRSAQARRRGRNLLGRLTR